MRRVVELYKSSVGKKFVMAVTGALLLLFVIGHVLGNMKIFQGPEKFNAYAEYLREMGAPVLGHSQALWLVRIALLAAVAIHITAAAQLTLASYRARPIRYDRFRRLSFSYASHTMRWGGVIVAGFVIYHLLHFTWGSAHHDFIPGDVYHNVVSGFRVWPVAVVYMVAMVPLGMHIYHGLWSAFQTMGINNPRYNRWRRTLAGVVAAGIFLGYISTPLAVLAGIID